jgi:glycosyltransferase involved in cell wall biosynthesis
MTERRRAELSIVVPVFNEQESVKAFFEQVEPVLEGHVRHYEIVCVNDGSSDQTMDALVEERARNPCIKIIDLSRNFGKEAALTAGIDFSTGDAVVPMDVDLQDPPDLIPEMIACWRKGFEVVLAIRSNRSSDTAAKRGTANLFYRLMGRIGDVQLPANAGDFRLMDRKVVDALKLLPERTRFMKGIFAWLGFSTTNVYYARAERASGEGKWSYWKLWNLALEGILSFTTLPLRIWTYLGAIVTVMALAYIVVIVFRTLVYGADVPGYPSIMVTVLFFSGVLMVGLGVIGEYLGRIFIEVKGRPIYLVRDVRGFDEAGGQEGPGSSANLVAVSKGRR